MIPKMNDELVSLIIDMLNSMPMPVMVGDIDLNCECTESDYFKAGWNSAIELATCGLLFKSKKDGADYSLN